jgi:hypothetical protein
VRRSLAPALTAGAVTAVLMVVSMTVLHARGERFRAECFERLHGVQVVAGGMYRSPMWLCLDGAGRVIKTEG